MGKEIALDVVLQLCKAEPGRVIKANVKKSRNYAEPSGAYLEMQIDTSEKGERITFQVLKAPKSKAHHGGESSDVHARVEIPEPAAAQTPSLEEAIVKYVSVNPDIAQGKLADALGTKEIYGARSSIQARIKAMSESGKLPHWKNRPKTHYVAVQPAPKVGED